MGIVGPPGHRAPKPNLRGLMKARLPDWAFALLSQAGEVADQRSMPAFVVGGFVRDLLLGRDNLDLDLLVEGDGLAFARARGREMGARIKAHKRFGTPVRVFPDGFKLELPMAGGDSYRLPGRCPLFQR